MRPFSFRVDGIPVPQGSMKAYRGRGGKARIVHAKSSELEAWRTAVNLSAVSAANKAGVRLPVDVPVTVKVEFRLPRPARPKFPRWPGTKPDLDKLTRAVGDALSPRQGRRIITDDSRITDWHMSKRYAGKGQQPGATITILGKDHPMNYTLTNILWSLIADARKAHCNLDRDNNETFRLVWTDKHDIDALDIYWGPDGTPTSADSSNDRWIAEHLSLYVVHASEADNDAPTRARLIHAVDASAPLTSGWAFTQPADALLQQSYPPLYICGPKNLLAMGKAHLSAPEIFDVITPIIIIDGSTWVNSRIDALQAQTISINNSEFDNGRWSEVYLPGALVANTRLNNLAIKDSSLQCAVFHTSTLVDSTLKNVNLTGADLSGLDVQNVNMTRVNLTNAKLPTHGHWQVTLHDCTLPDGTRTN